MAMASFAFLQVLSCPLLSALDDAARPVKLDRGRPAARLEERQPVLEAAAAPGLSWLDPFLDIPERSVGRALPGEAAKRDDGPAPLDRGLPVHTLDLQARRAATLLEELMPFLEAPPRQLLARTDAVETLAERAAVLAVQKLGARAEIDRAVVSDVGTSIEKNTLHRGHPKGGSFGTASV
jgi:hypothetical protein